MMMPYSNTEREMQNRHVEIQISRHHIICRNSKYIWKRWSEVKRAYSQFFAGYVHFERWVRAKSTYQTYPNRYVIAIWFTIKRKFIAKYFLDLSGPPYVLVLSNRIIRIRIVHWWWKNNNRSFIVSVTHKESISNSTLLAVRIFHAELLLRVLIIVHSYRDQDFYTFSNEINISEISYAIKWNIFFEITFMQYTFM